MRMGIRIVAKGTQEKESIFVAKGEYIWVEHKLFVFLTLSFYIIGKDNVGGTTKQAYEKRIYNGS